MGERNPVLSGWSAIARHLDCTPRHAQRLEKTRGLPVHRNGNLSAPFAYREELDRWLRGEEDPQGAATPDVPASEPSRTGESGETAGQSPATADGVTLPPQPGVPSTVPQASTEQRRFTGPASWRRWTMIASGGILLLALAGIALHFLPEGEPLAGDWSRTWGGWIGHSQGAGRLDTGRMVGPGSRVQVTIEPLGLDWSGGLEIFQDETHWTFVDCAPTTHELIVWRYPSGQKNNMPVPDIVKGNPVVLRLRLEDSAMEVKAGLAQSVTIPLLAGDVSEGHLVLRTGKQEDEYGPPQPGNASMVGLKIHGVYPDAEDWLAAPLARKPLAPAHSYQAILFNVDDQEDLLVNGKRVATVGCYQTAGPFELAPFLRSGKNLLTLQVFNRQGPSCYGVRLLRDGEALWEEQCGTAQMRMPACPELGTRMGLVKELSYTLETP